MKVALLSDIHGNDLALQAIVQELKNAQIDTLLICGDFVGYYYRIREVIDSLESFNIFACKGNHEDLFQDWLSGPQLVKDQLSSKYGNSFKIASQTLTTKQINWLTQLPHPTVISLNGKTICLCHGTPWDLNTYLYENTIDNYREQFQVLASEYDVILVGHSHYQFLKAYESLVIVNPGSVGQPRSGKALSTHNSMVRAQWATLDIEAMSIDFHTTVYDATPLFEEIKKYDPSHSYLKNVLLRRE